MVCAGDAGANIAAKIIDLIWEMRHEYGGEGGTVNELGLFVKIGDELCPKHHPFAVIAQGAGEYKQFFTAFGG